MIVPGRAPGKFTIRQATRDDYAAVERLLNAASLPVEGLDPTLDDFFVAEQADQQVVGTIGLEPYGEAALLRSAAVAPAAQGVGVGEALVNRLSDHARTRGIRELYLLTTTALGYFTRFGFMRIDRADVPPAVRESVEFRESCPASAAAMRKPLSSPRVLFLCTGNSARSRMAETILNRKAGGRFVAESAGSRPAARVNPHAIAALERHGYSWTGGPPRSVDRVLGGQWDFVITVCDRAKESCPVFPGQPVQAHWGMPDPAEVEGTDQEIRRAFDDALIAISRRLDLFLALPLEKLSAMALASRVQAIGHLPTSPAEDAISLNHGG